MSFSSYLIQANIYLVLFYIFYALVLQNETFFKWNRLFLVSSAILSFLIPLMQSDWVRKMFVTDEVAQVSILLNPNALQEIQISSRDAEQSFTMYEWISLIYLGGVLLFVIRFLWQLSQVAISFDKGNRAQSFFKKIKVSDGIPSRDSIIKHEEIHVKQLHSADVIFFELMSIVNWFNPAVYAYKKSAKYIHEFIADDAASEGSGKSEYALLLVSNAFGIQKEQLTNNFFNQSLLKKRIMMLHKTKSKKVAILKYGFSAPLFAAMIVLSSATISKKEINSLNEIAVPVSLKASQTIFHSKEDLSKAVEYTRNQSAESNSTKKLDEIKATTQDHARVNEAVTSDLSILKGLSDKDTSAIVNTAAVEVMPEYPGGIRKFLEWVGANYKYPPAAQKANISGRMLIQFIVEKDGSLTNFNVVKDLGYETGETAKQLLMKSKKWKPGIQNGKPVRVQYTLPLMLQFKEDNKTSADSIKIDYNSQNPPLIILNGKEVTSDYMKQIKKTDIKSIAVIKDKDATEKYGEKGKNGVIIITLKD